MGEDQKAGRRDQEDVRPDTPLGKRRTKAGKAPAPMAVEALTEALTEKEPITVIVSDKGWIRAHEGSWP
jgi:hypothetical protein